MKKAEAFPRRFLSAPDLNGKPFVVTIARATPELLKTSDGKESEKLVLYFVGGRKGLVMNLTNWDSLTEIFGSDDSDTWLQGQIELYPVRVQMGGKMVDGIRVRRPTAPASAQPSTPPKQTPPAAADDMGGDKIPW